MRGSFGVLEGDGGWVFGRERVLGCLGERGYLGVWEREGGWVLGKERVVGC